MTRSRIFLLSIAACVSLVATSHAKTIIKLDFSSVETADVKLFDGLLSTMDDGDVDTAGDQNTKVSFYNHLTGMQEVLGDSASFSLAGVALTGNAARLGTTLMQDTRGGRFQLYDLENTLLLEGTMGVGTLVGPMSESATGSWWDVQFGNLVGGSLLNELQNLTRSSLSISFTDVNNGAGLWMAEDQTIGSFTADATASIGASVPEPAGIAFVLATLLAGVVTRRRS